MSLCGVVNEGEPLVSLGVVVGAWVGRHVSCMHVLLPRGKMEKAYRGLAALDDQCAW